MRDGFLGPIVTAPFLRPVLAPPFRCPRAGPRRLRRLPARRGKHRGANQTFKEFGLTNLIHCPAEYVNQEFFTQAQQER
jgi:hypothetical protein